MLRRVAVLVGLVAATALVGAPVAQPEVITNESIPFTDFTVFIPCANSGPISEYRPAGKTVDGLGWFQRRRS